MWANRNGPSNLPGGPWWDFPTSNNCSVPPGNIDDAQQYNMSRGPFPCPQCNKVYQYKYTLSTHLRYECGKEPQFQCPYCPHRSKLKGNLMKHVRKIHANMLRLDSSTLSHAPLPNTGAQVVHDSGISK